MHRFCGLVVVSTRKRQTWLISFSCLRAGELSTEFARVSLLARGEDFDSLKHRMSRRAVFAESGNLEGRRGEERRDDRRFECSWVL